jgi:putative ATPase
LVLKERSIEIKEYEALLHFSGGDARKLLNILDLVTTANVETNLVVTNEMVYNYLQHNSLAYDKNGEQHYDIISAFIKSIRGSDPNAAIYWLARMLEGGEDPKFIARRLIISAAEDIGLANPNALLLANAAFDAIHKLGMPEGRIPLAEATIYLATSPKSNSAYKAINTAIERVKQTHNQPVPLHLRNAPTQLMAELGYAGGYLYPHDYAGNFINQQYLPDALVGETYWQPCQNLSEQKLQDYLAKCWQKNH